MDFVVLRDEWSLATILRRLNHFERSLDIISFSGYYQHSKVEGNLLAHIFNVSIVSCHHLEQLIQ